MSIRRNHFSARTVINFRTTAYDPSLTAARRVPVTKPKTIFIIIVIIVLALLPVTTCNSSPSPGVLYYYIMMGQVLFSVYHGVSPFAQI